MLLFALCCAYFWVLAYASSIILVSYSMHKLQHYQMKWLYFHLSNLYCLFASYDYLHSVCSAKLFSIVYWWV